MIFKPMTLFTELQKEINIFAPPLLKAYIKRF